ncbi:MAG: DEAD/DEAH box helicase [Cyclobacteriaceae bacterium]
MISFDQLNIAPDILKAIKVLGFENPMPVQEKVIPLLLEEDKDIIALAQTGTGKTAAFGIPIIQLTNSNLNEPQTLILCPTRELCIQITNDLNDFSLHSRQVKILPVYGGASIEHQIRELKRGIHIIVATPGRLIDLIHRKAVKLASVKTVVLDEADEMLNMGFLDSIEEILQEVPDTRRTLLFSATMPREVARIAKNYMPNPIEVTIGTKNSGSSNVTHIYYLVPAREKYKVLRRICDSEPDIYGIIFCRTRTETQEIANKLMHDGYNADVLHGDLSQSQRDAVMNKFRIRNIQMLVATDVAARGLDVDDLTHVINYSLPGDAEVYTHRSGRTGRAGKKGISISLANLKEKHLLAQIEKKINKPFVPMKVPTGREICARQLFHWVGKLETIEADHEQIDAVLPEIHKRLEGLSREELIQRVVYLEFNRFLEDYKNAPDIEAPSPEKMHNLGGERRGGERSQHSEEGYTRFFINLGKLDGLRPNQLIELINQNTRGTKIPVGRIDLLREFSFFEIKSEFSDVLLSSMKNSMHGDRTLIVKVAKEKDSGSERGSSSRKREGGRKDFGKKDFGKKDFSKKSKSKKRY